MSNNLRIQEMYHIEDLESYFNSFKDISVSLNRSDSKYLNDHFIDIFSYLFNNGIIYSTSIKYSIENIVKYGFFSFFTTESLLYLDETEQHLKHLSNSEYNKIYQQQISFFQQYIKKSKNIQLLNDNTDPLLKKTISFFSVKNNLEPDNFGTMFLNDLDFRNKIIYIIEKYLDYQIIIQDNFLFSFLEINNLFYLLKNDFLLYFSHFDSVFIYLNSLSKENFHFHKYDFVRYVLTLKINNNFINLFIKHTKYYSSKNILSFFFELFCYIQETTLDDIQLNDNIKQVNNILSEIDFDYSLCTDEAFIFNKDFCSFTLSENHIELFFLYFLNTQKHFDNILMYKEHFHPIIQRNIEKKLIEEQMNNF